MRVVIDILLPLLLPSALWVAWLIWRQHRALVAGQPMPGWDSVPWSWLLVAGGVLAVVVVVGGSLISSYSVGQYRPAYVDDHGKIIPGRIQ